MLFLGLFRCYNLRSHWQIKQKSAEVWGNVLILKKHYDKWSTWSTDVYIYIKEYLPLTSSQVANYCSFYFLLLWDSENTLQQSPSDIPQQLFLWLCAFLFLPVCESLQSLKEANCFTPWSSHSPGHLIWPCTHFGCILASKAPAPPCAAVFPSTAAPRL